MNAADWATVIVSVATLGGSALAVWAYRRFIRPVHLIIKAMWADHNPNGGNSLRDAINSIRRDVGEIRDNMVAGVQRNRSLLQSFSTPAFETDADGEYVWVNDAYLELVGHDLSDITQSGWFTHIRQEERAAIRAEWDAAIEQVRNFDMTYTIYNNKLNTVAYVRARATVLHGLTDNVMGYLGFVDVLRRDVLKRD